ncbi:MAG: DNA repair protein RecO [Thermodesulfobacteriales bacterium]|jgi:DNA repair protein RecO (recombination protein O)
MDSTEALLLRKTPYRDSDYILSLFTKDLGKISGIAINAKNSMKRFGARLEPFVHLRVRFKETGREFKLIQDTETIQVFPGFIEDIELFTLGSLLLETTDILTPRESPNEEMFDLLSNALKNMNSKESPLPIVLQFQLQALSISGYEPNLYSCAKCGEAIEGDSYFSINGGGAVCFKCAGDKKKGLIFSKDFLFDQALMESNLEKVLKYIKLFIKFTERHTEKELKSGKFIEELKL